MINTARPTRSWKSQPVTGKDSAHTADRLDRLAAILAAGTFNETRTLLDQLLTDQGIKWSTSRTTRYARAIASATAEDAVRAHLLATFLEAAPGDRYAPRVNDVHVRDYATGARAVHDLEARSHPTAHR